MVPREDKAVTRLYVYIRGGVLDVTIDDIQRRVESFFGVKEIHNIERPLYGMKLTGRIDEGITEFIQEQPTEVYRKYYAMQLNSKIRLYIEKTAAGLTTMLVSTDFLDNFKPIPGEDDDEDEETATSSEKIYLREYAKLIDF